MSCVGAGDHVLADTGGCTYLYLSRFQVSEAARRPTCVTARLTVRVTSLASCLALRGKAALVRAPSHSSLNRVACQVSLALSNWGLWSYPPAPPPLPPPPPLSQTSAISAGEEEEEGGDAVGCGGGEGCARRRKRLIIDGQEASRIKSFYQEYFRVNDINDPVGLTHFFATSTSYNAFGIQTQCSSTQAAAPGEVTACWLPPAPSYKDEVGEGMMRKHKDKGMRKRKDKGKG